MSLETIVCHVDLSPRSRAGARIASALADRHDAQLVLVHADELPALASQIGREPGDPRRRATSRVAIDHERALRRRLSALSRRLETSDDVKPRLELLRRRSVDGFLEYAGTHDADLVVVAADEPSAVRRLLRRSVTESVARRAPCPVLALAGNCRVRRPLRHLLVAIDFSEQSATAARVAVDVLDGRGTLSLVYVCIDRTGRQYLPGPRDLERLRGFASHLNLGAVEVALYVDHGDPATRIAQRAQELDVDAIVVGSHPHEGWRDRLLGTMADRILERANVPVFTVPTVVAEDEPMPEYTDMDRTLDASFPASDPPSWWAGTDTH